MKEAFRQVLFAQLGEKCNRPSGLSRPSSPPPGEPTWKLLRVWPRAGPGTSLPYFSNPFLAVSHNL